jgi:branched-chain amino acid transport system permease protein
MLLFVILGLGSGALYAGISLGLVLDYRGSGAVNVAMGAVAQLGAYIFYGLHTGGYLFLPPLPFAPQHLSMGAPLGLAPAFVLTVVICAGVGLVIEFAVWRPLRRSAPLAKLLASLGVFIILQAIMVLRFGTTGQSAPAILPNGVSDVVRISGVNVPLDEIYLAVIVVALSLALGGAYRFTRFGAATRAAQENEVAAMYFGWSPGVLSAVNTVLAACLAGTVGMLAAPMTQLDPETIALAVVPALGAALLARFTSFWLAAVAGLGFGIIESLTLYAQSEPWFPTTGGVQLPGVADLLVFLIIIATMYWRGASLPERGGVIERRLPPAPAATGIGRPAMVAAVVLAAAFPLLSYGFRQALINTLIGVLVCLSLVVITGYVGQISLAQVALAGVAGFVVSDCATHLGLEFPLGPLLGVAAATAIGLAAGLSALRVRGVNLAVVTIAAAVALQNFGFDNVTWGGGVGGSPIPPPTIFGLHFGPSAATRLGGGTLPSPVFGFVCAGVVILAASLVASVRRSNLGQRMLAVRSNERAAAAAGIKVTRVKLTAFGLSSFLAGLAGVLYGYNFGSVSADRFDVITGLSFVAFAYVGGITTVLGACLAGIGVTEGLIGHVLETWFGVSGEYEALVGGLLLVVTIAAKPEGLAGNAREDGRRLLAAVTLPYRAVRGRFPSPARAVPATEATPATEAVPGTEVKRS